MKNFANSLVLLTLLTSPAFAKGKAIEKPKSLPSHTLVQIHSRNEVEKLIAKVKSEFKALAILETYVDGIEQFIELKKDEGYAGPFAKEIMAMSKKKAKSLLEIKNKDIEITEDQISNDFDAIRTALTLNSRSLETSQNVEVALAALSLEQDYQRFLLQKNCMIDLIKTNKTKEEEADGTDEFLSAIQKLNSLMKEQKEEVSEAIKGLLEIAESKFVEV